jgi:ABC-2 type transport system permease protein
MRRGLVKIEELARGVRIAMTTDAVSPLVSPGRGGGLLDVVRRRYLLRLVVRRELRRRYQGSLLGLGWSYVRPAVNFCIYFFVVGVFLKMAKRIPDFPVYLFSGMVLVNFFTETLTTATWSVIGNRALIQKIYLPREVFPVASMLVSFVYMVPAMVILCGGAMLAGWTPSVLALGSAVLALAIVIPLALALGLLSAAVNVFFRDFGQVVDILTLVVPWSTPMVYRWTAVKASASALGLQIYLANPMVTAVSLFQRAFWWPATGRVYRPGDNAFPDHLTTRGLASLAVALVLLAACQTVFRRAQWRFAQEL